MNDPEPGAKAAIDAVAADDKADLLAMTVHGFRTDAEALLLRDMLWYAAKKGVEIRIAPISSQLQQERHVLRVVEGKPHRRTP